MNDETRLAMVELLLLAPYLDKHLSTIEDEVLERGLTAIGWDPTKPEALSLPAAFATVREVTTSELKTAAFLQTRTATIKAAGESSLAFEWIGRILGSDGMTGSESQFLQRIKGLLID